MTERHLRAVLAEAERVAEHYDQVAKSKDSPAHEYLRYSVLRLLEGDANSIPEEVPQVDGVTVGYGRDQAMYDSWGSDVSWKFIVLVRKPLDTQLDSQRQIERNL